MKLEDFLLGIGIFRKQNRSIRTKICVYQRKSAYHILIGQILYRRPARWRLLIHAFQHVNPRRAILQLTVDRRLQQLDFMAVCAHHLAAFERLHPDARHFRNHFAVAVGAHATAGAVAQIFGAVHGAGHACAVQDTLAAHLAIKGIAFDPLFAPDHEPLCRARIHPF